ncbi:MAG: LysR family transcriptional regulator [Oscillospiraceae bacterium]
MDIRQMYYLVEICDSPSLSAAAAKMYLTPQALSKSISAWEEELGTPLFYREKGRLIITPFGREVLKEVRPFVASHRALCLHLKRLGEQEQGRIGIAFAHGVLHALSLNFINLLEAQIPSASFDVIELPDALAEQAILNEESDIGFLVGHPAPQEMFECQLLRQHRLCAVVNKAHPLATRQSLRVEDLAGHPLVTKNPLFRVYHLIENLAEKKGIPLIYALRSPDEIFWLYLLEQNHGVGIGVSFLSDRPNQHSENLVSIPFEETELNWEVYAAIKKGRYLSSSTRFLFDNIHDVLADIPL